MDFSFALLGKIFSYCVPMPCMSNCYFVVLATRKWFHPVLALRPVSVSFSVVVILVHFIMLADKFYNNNYYFS